MSPQLITPIVNTSPLAHPYPGCSIQALRDTLNDIRVSTGKIEDVLEKEVQYSQHVFATVSGAMGEGLIITDDKGFISVVNLAASVFLGLSPEGMHGTDISDWFPYIDRDILTLERGWRAHPYGREELIDLDVFVAKLRPRQEGVHPERGAANCVIIIRPLHPLPGQGVSLGTSNVANLSSALKGVFPSFFFYTDDNGNNVQGSKEFYDFFDIPVVEMSLKSVRDLFPSAIASLFSPESTDRFVSALECTLTPRLRDNTKDLVLYKSIFTDYRGIVVGHTATVFDISILP